MSRATALRLALVLFAVCRPGSAAGDEAMHGVVGHWTFERAFIDPHFEPVSAGRGGQTAFLDRAGGVPAVVTHRRSPAIHGEHGLVDFDGWQALYLDGCDRQVRLLPGLPRGVAPTAAVTVEAWVRVLTPRRAGAILSAMDEDPLDPRGWQLGYRGDRFVFIVATYDEATGRSVAHRVEAPEPFAPDRWYHIVGVYDGYALALYRDGREVARNEAPAGSVVVPVGAPYLMGTREGPDGAVHMHGCIHEVRVHEQALIAREVERFYRARADLLKPNIPLRRGPWIREQDDDTLRIAWDTHRPGRGAVRFGVFPNLHGRVAARSDGTRHVARLGVAGREGELDYILVLTEPDGTETQSVVHTVDPTPGRTWTPAEESGPRQLPGVLVHTPPNAEPWALRIHDLRAGGRPGHGACIQRGGDLLLAHGPELWVIEARTGRPRRFIALPGPIAESGRVWGWFSAAGGLILGSATAAHVFGGHDELEPASAPERSRAGILGDELFALSFADGLPRWRHRPRGLIVNAGIAIGDGRVFFVESRNPRLALTDNRRVGAEWLGEWQLVALDLAGGEPQWSRPFAFPRAAERFQLDCRDGILVAACHAERLHLYALAAFDGQSIWSHVGPLPDRIDSSSRRLPRIDGDRVPAGSRIFDLYTGEALGQALEPISTTPAPLRPIE